MTKPDMILWSSDALGVYIPQHFAESVRRDCLTGVDAADMDVLAAGPEHEHYGDAWYDVLDNAVITDPETGTAYRLHQDGDLWAVPEGMEWCDETDGFVWPEETDG